MKEYRVCIVAPDGHIEQCIEFRALNDQVAIEHAPQHMNGDVEVIVERVIGRLKPATL
jgi:hypothetical protein